ncbi:MAG: hypothetical protein K2K82_08695 [Muribaculaceae bacterium]|nr:hypothetical protein [Muribaculaceae bacterium]
MKRPIKLYQLAPKEMQTRFALVPYGRYMNVQLQKASAGAILDFIVDWRKDRFVLIRKATLKVNSSVFSLLLKSIYGEDATWQKLSEEWRAECVIEGLGSKAFSEDDVLLLEVKPYVKEEYEAEQERIRLAEERERIKKEIAEGTYRHKDIIY